MEMKIHKALHKIQKELKVPKKQYNSFGKYNYRSCEDIVEAVKKQLPDGYTLLLSDELIAVGERYYVKAVALLSDGAESLSTCGYAREALSKKGMDDCQITGTASTYARKYALNGMFAIDDTKDYDTDESRIETERHRENADKAEATKKLATETAVATKLSKMLEGVESSGRLKDFIDNQQIKDLRDKLFINNPELSQKIETSVDKKRLSFIAIANNGAT